MSKTYANHFKRTEVYEAYKGDELIAIGNLGELAYQLDTKVSSLRYNLSDAYKRKLENAKEDNTWRYLVKVEGGHNEIIN